MSGLPAVVERAPAHSDLRASERIPCDVPASCQPPSDWKRGGQQWTARVRDISAGGLRLVLGRRFERGAGLAIQLSGPDADASFTLLARVMNVRAEGGAWILGCAFISPLSDEELQAITHTAAESAPAETAAVTSVADVHFRGTLPGGCVVERRIRQVKSDRQWPLRPGRLIELRFCDRSGAAAAVRVRVHDCRSVGGGWVLDGAFVGAPPAILLPQVRKRRI